MLTIREVEVVNQALQCLGTRTTVTWDELQNNSTNEAIQANIILRPLRDATLRMAPWNCAQAFTNLELLTSVPGTPENTSVGQPLWAPGIPAPPWAYEYIYPKDCLKPLYIIPQFQSGFTSGLPISGVVTGGAASFWQGPPVKFKVSIDKFWGIYTAQPVNPGTGYNVDDLIHFAKGPTNEPPIGVQATLRVVAVGGAGDIITVVPVKDMHDTDADDLGFPDQIGGHYFIRPPNPVTPSSTERSPENTNPVLGSGATFNFFWDDIQFDAPVILTNQEFAVLAYIRQIVEPGVMDPLLLQAWVTILSARLVMALVGDKQLANIKVQEANNYILEARKADGNEGLTVNDVTPDWVRVRGISYSDYSYTPNVDFNWGQLWTPF
jgi:hypothetical protein